MSGWGALLLCVVFTLIAVLAWWAASSDAASRKIHAEWGIWTIAAVAIMFVGVALAPFVSRLLDRTPFGSLLAVVGTAVARPVNFFGRILSAADALLVFAVAVAAGANRSGTLLRYSILISTVCACAALGYSWPAPAAFAPIAWGFVTAFSVSRRWYWIEQDRELAMLNPNLPQQHVRVGFEQNLRDEALVAFLSMFLLVPLALRQAQLYAQDSGISLFEFRDSVDPRSMMVWVQFYGAELAKAVPFVDWAEVYSVEGDATITARSQGALHAIFATRILIDLVFLAALLQAVSSSARDAQQKELFYRKRALARLDPFTEPDALRSLVRRSSSGSWERAGDLFEEFPRYDVNRLVELRTHPDERVRHAAEFLLDRDGAANDPHYRLSAKASEHSVSPEEVRALFGSARAFA